MINKTLFFLIITSTTLVLTGCGPSAEVATVKQPYYVKTQQLVEFGQFSTIEKNSTVEGEQEISVSAQTRGRVRSIDYKEGDKIRAGEMIVALSDTIENVGIMLERASISEERARITYEQSEANLAKSIKDAQLALEKAKNDKRIIEQTVAQSIKRAELDMYNSNIGITGSKADLDIKKALTDLQNSSQSVKQNLAVQLNSLRNLLDSTIYQGDVILGVSPEFSLYNDRYEIYISAQDNSKKNVAEDLLRQLYQIQSDIAGISVGSDSSDVEFIETFERINGYYGVINRFLTSMVSVLEHSVVSVELPQNQLDGYVSIFRSLQASYQGSKQSFTQYENSAKNLFATIVNQDQTTLIDQQTEIIRKNIEIQANNAKLAYDAAKTNADDMLFKADYAVTSAQNMLDNLLATKNTQLALLDNAISDSIMAKTDIETRYDKLSIRAPIDGTIANILVDEGQEVGIGTPIFEIVNEDNQQIEIFVGSDEIELINPETDVYVENGDEVYEAKVVATSPVASKTLQYKVILALKTQIPFVGSVVKVKIPIVADYTLLPIDVVTVTQAGKGFIYIRSGDTIEKKFVELGRVYNGTIELIDDLPGNTEVVVSSLHSYEDTSFELVFEGEEEGEEVKK